MADYTLALQGADDEAFTTGALSDVFVVLGASPIPVFAEQGRDAWGATVQTTLYTWEIAVVLEIIPVTEFGTIVDLVAILAKKHLRILATGTVLPRKLTAAGANFWTDGTVGWVRSNRPVARVGLDVAPDFESGADRVTLRLRDVYPNT